MDTLCGNEVWHLWSLNGILDPTCVDVIDAINLVVQGDSVVVVGNDVAVPVKCKKRKKLLS